MKRRQNKKLYPQNNRIDDTEDFSIINSNNKLSNSIELNLSEYKQWTKDIICSLLIVETSLTIEDAKVLYAADFNANSLDCIIKNIKKETVLDRAYKSNPNINRNIINSVVERITSVFNINQESILIPLLKVQDFIGLVPNFSTSIPYQNNKSCVFEVGKVLLENMNLKETTQKTLLINFAYYGFGKTRFGVEFLDLWKQFVKQHSDQYHTLIQQYGECNVSKLFNAELIYVDLRGYSNSKETVERISKLVPTNDNSYFVVFDEYTAYCAGNKNLSLQDSATLDLFDQTALIDKSPCHRIELNSLTRDNLHNIMSLQIPIMKEKLEYVKKYNIFLNEMMSETAGIPLLVSIVIELLQDPKYLELCSFKFQEFLKVFNEMEEIVPKRILVPFSDQREYTFQVFYFLMFISQTIPNFNRHLKLNTSMFDFTKIEGLEEVSAVDWSTLAIHLNCYISPVEEDNNFVRVLFPRRTIQNYTNYFPLFSIEPFVNATPQIIGSEYAFSSLVASFIIWKARLGFLENKTFSSVFPFLKDTKMGNRPCINLLSCQTNKKLTKKYARIGWCIIHKNYKLYMNKMNFMLEKSIGPEKFVILDLNLWWCLHEMKNIDNFNFRELCTILPKVIHIVFTVFYQSKVNYLNKKMLNDGKVIISDSRISTALSNKYTVPSNITLVIVDDLNISNLILNNHDRNMVTNLLKSTQ